MKLKDDDHRELLEDVFAPDSGESLLSSVEVVRMVESAREARRRARRRIAVATTAAVIAVGAWISMRPIAEQRFKPKEAVSMPPSGPQAPTADTHVAIAPPRMERIDDETMLGMLKDQPTALVRWPDGRRTLLLLTR